MYYLYNIFSLSKQPIEMCYNKADLANIRLISLSSLNELEEFRRDECFYQEWWPVYCYVDGHISIIPYDNEEQAKDALLEWENRLLKYRRHYV